MTTKCLFVELTPGLQLQAVSRFLDAHNGDGYLYELDIDGNILCRCKWRAWE